MYIHSLSTYIYIDINAIRLDQNVVLSQLVDVISVMCDPWPISGAVP